MNVGVSIKVGTPTSFFVLSRVEILHFFIFLLKKVFFLSPICFSYV
ncbi:hypothetical protein EVA_06602 [gut metagenome]|uniref:Uncharacterized protein n=1 Tax=gut metagenome TaxID=749906 RepID=J9CYF9_9ZZZZ